MKASDQSVLSGQDSTEHSSLSAGGSSSSTGGWTDARQAGASFTTRPRQPTNTHYKAANIENEYSGADLVV